MRSWSSQLWQLVRANLTIIAIVLVAVAILGLVLWRLYVARGFETALATGAFLVTVVTAVYAAGTLRVARRGLDLTRHEVETTVRAWLSTERMLPDRPENPISVDFVVPVINTGSVPAKNVHHCLALVNANDCSLLHTRRGYLTEIAPNGRIAVHFYRMSEKSHELIRANQAILSVFILYRAPSGRRHETRETFLVRFSEIAPNPRNPKRKAESLIRIRVDPTYYR